MRQPKECCGSLAHFHRKGCGAMLVPQTEDKKENIIQRETGEETVEQKLLRKVGELERRDAENQKKLKMLYDVADKGRVFNYENQNAEKKASRVKLSRYKNKFIVGWRTVRDEILFNPMTGKPSGEAQEYEILLYEPGSATTTDRISGYVNFTNARYDDRIECLVKSKSTSFDGSTTFVVLLPDGSELPLDSKFIN